MICVALIVKNEFQVIERCLESVRHFADRVVIIDTGSTDDTIEKVRSLNLPLILEQREWVNFGHNRKELVDLAAATMSPDDWILVLDADMTVEGTPEPPDADAGMVELDRSYYLPLLLKASKPWRYVGATHEYLDCDEPFTRANVVGMTVRHHLDGSNRQDKFERDLSLLLEEHYSDPNNPRTVFYLAQTYKDLGERARAIETYDLRRRMGGFEEERWYAQWKAGELRAETDSEGCVRHLLAAFQARPNRAEPLHTLAWFYRLRNNHWLALLFAERAVEILRPDGDILFVENDVYNWGASFEFACALANTGHFSAAFRVNNLLMDRELPENIRDAVVKNQQWVESQLQQSGAA